MCSLINAFLALSNISLPLYSRAFALGCRAEMCVEGCLTFVCTFVPDQTDGDQTRLVVGVVVGLLVAAVVLGLAYWVYMKKSK